MLRNLFTKTLILFLTLISLCACNDEPKVKIANRTVLIYMAANNSLGSMSYDNKDILEIQDAVTKGALGKNGRLMLFHAPITGDQILYEVKNDGSLEIVREYEGKEYAVSSNFMLQVFTDAKTWAPAEDYGLILWSHSLGWTQNGLDDEGPFATPQSWGEDRYKTMNITTLSRVLKASPWSWIYFDCCYMGSVEVAYELAPVLPKMVASASEIPLDGMPYDKNLPLFFLPEADLVGAARNTYDYYNALEGQARTATIAVLDLSGMNDLAKATIPIYQNSSTVSPYSFSNLPLSLDQVPLFYDFGVYVKGLCSTNDINAALLDSWEKAYDNVVLYHEATPYLWSYISLKDFTGMSTYIARNQSEQTYRGYDTLKWYTDVARWLFDK